MMLNVKCTLPVNIKKNENASNFLSNNEININNKKILEFVLSLADQPTTPYKERETDDLELNRLERKIDAIFLLLQDLVRDHYVLPETQKVELGLSEITVYGDFPYNQSEPLLVELYLSDAIPKPITLPVITISREKSEIETKIHLKIVGLDQNVQDLYEKFIFRLHRQEIHKHNPIG